MKRNETVGHHGAGSGSTNLRSYLLGNITETEREAIEQRILTDDAIAEDLDIAEEELIEEYLDGKLPADERSRFDEMFLAPPERREKVRVATALRRHRVDAVSLLPRRTAALAAIAAAAVIGFLILRRDEGPQQQAVTPPSAPTASAPQVPPAVTTINTAAQSIATITLRTGSTRDSGQLPRLVLQPDTGTVELRMEIEDSGYSSYNAKVISADGATIGERDNLRVGKGMVMFSVEPSLLPDGDYIVQLDGVLKDGTAERTGSYPLRVLRPR